MKSSNRRLSGRSAASIIGVMAWIAFTADAVQAQEKAVFFGYGEVVIVDLDSQDVQRYSLEAGSQPYANALLSPNEQYAALLTPKGAWVSKLSDDMKPTKIVSQACYFGKWSKNSSKLVFACEDNNNNTIKLSFWLWSKEAVGAVKLRQ
ncbi:MAG: hypothetical protein HY747_00070 [Elusimicrobia bacterium]|nr:hypothetical protein [Elusimicrobiota bacterium]